MEGPVGRVEAWLEGVDAIPVLDEASVSLVREHVREQGRQAGLPELATAALVSAASELAHNQLRHARDGHVAVRLIHRGDTAGVEVVAADAGAGIEDVARALEGRRSSPASLGAGLAAVFELSDEVDLDTRLGEGTCVRARKLASMPERGWRVGVYGRPCEGEEVSGDDAIVVRTAASLLVGVADGLGHGPLAHLAAGRARAAAAAASDFELEALLGRVDAALRDTRGAVMTVARLSGGEGQLTLAAVGNVGAHHYGIDEARRFGGSSFVLGAPGGARHIRPDTHALGPRDVLVLFTDGIVSRMDVGEDGDLLREHPVVIAQRIVERFGRTNDDVLVLVVA